MNKNYFKKPAFTLIELLVVIAIIGVLATLAVVSLQSARAQARDAKRIADIKQVQTALELYFNDQGYYPASTSVTSSIFYEDSVYMARFPKAPTPADGDCDSEENQYVYSEQGVDNGSYFISFCLGNKIGPFNNNNKCAFPGGVYDFACGGNENNFSLGDFHQGGIIFYLNSNWGLVILTNDQGGAPFSNVLDYLGTSYSIGEGKSNSLSIVSQAGHNNSAARVCEELSLAGYNDWFLPSRDELVRAIDEVNLEANLNEKYISSSEEELSPFDKAIVVGNSGDIIPSYYYSEIKNTGGGLVRCIRKFTF